MSGTDARSTRVGFLNYKNKETIWRELKTPRDFIIDI